MRNWPIKYLDVCRLCFLESLMSHHLILDLSCIIEKLWLAVFLFFILISCLELLQVLSFVQWSNVLLAVKILHFLCCQMNFKQKARKMANTFFLAASAVGSISCHQTSFSLLEKEKIGCNIYVALFSVWGTSYIKYKNYKFNS